MQVSLTLQVPHQWFHNPEGHVEFLMMQLRPLGHEITSWSKST